MAREILTQEQFIQNTLTVTSLVSSGELRTKDPRIVLGLNSSVSNAGIAVGNSATVTGTSAIQIGQGTNSANNTFQVFTYPVLISDGSLDLNRLPAWSRSTNPHQIRINLSLSPLATAAEVPFDDKTYVRKNGAWTDLIVLASPNGDKWNLKIDNNGILQTNKIS